MLHKDLAVLIHGSNMIRVIRVIRILIIGSHRSMSNPIGI